MYRRPTINFARFNLAKFTNCEVKPCK